MNKTTFKASDFARIERAELNQSTLFNIMRIENISKSKLNQMEDWQHYHDPNSVSVDRIKNSNRTIIREIKDSSDDNGPRDANTNVNVTYKLLLRDFHNNYTFAYEQEPLNFLRSHRSNATPLGIDLGGRLLVKQGATISRGVIFLDHKNCDYQGSHPEDEQLTRTLNDGLVQKEIDILKSELGL
ncbi:uncharacterized protein SPAPADRAFT_149840 [Spathaspora passalidarum NRRL Y-27907]|uniref:RecQ mediated genome instability protein 1 OB-fold domain-containing protein n=1 Tax=Spathaspora passalidarum (strain NRRL Y-27907 / 11-Y1) TaxID=619300 RepID=G3AM21_SPAPN|nr:uncharacterized protein SPAPADRAFT_149840 [Spathaspora passalidarum NRRL Y-27907]EGW32725.1 hypothetical protein SPAPADRAFT_149840 [Spathaspora passalidarum NRRL Y-27907]